MPQALPPIPKRAFLAISLALTATLIACHATHQTPTQTPTPMSVLCHNTVEGLLLLTANTGPLPGEGEDVFDVNEYFSVLDHLSLQEGYVLDWVYRSDLMGGEPHLYARLEDQASYPTYQEFEKHHGDERYEYLDHIELDDTAESYLQFVALRVMGDQFYLFWHANYNDYQIICDSADLRKTLWSPDEFGQTISPDIRRRARRLTVEPIVELDGDVARVRVLVFTKWGGFLRWTYTIDRSFPHKILEQRSVLVPYNCGVMF